MTKLPFCIHYAGECPKHISFYYNEGMEKCPYSKECYKKWFELGGILGLEGILKDGYKRYDE